MNVQDIIYTIREGLKEYTDDSRYTDDYIMYLVRIKRAALIRREYSNLQRTIDQETLQTICMALEEVEDSDCPDCLSDCSDCKIVRTVDKMPFTIELHNRSSITRVAFTQKSSAKINLVSRDKIIYAGEGPFEKRAVFAYLDNDGHIYLKSKVSSYKSKETISVTSLLDNPDDAAMFTGCNNNFDSCYDVLTSRYPMKSWMTETIIKTIISELASLKPLPADTVNNSNDDNG